MERQCHHCNAAIPDGTPFCAACGAPQIRVVAPEATIPPLPHDLPPQTLSAFSPTGSPQVVWAVAFKKCLIAAAATTILIMVVRYPLLILLSLPAGGWFSAFLYSRGDTRLPVNAGIGARIGAVTGLIAFGFYALMMSVVLIFQRSRFLEEVKNSLAAAAAQNSDPQAQQIVQKLMSPEGVAILLTLSAVFLFFMFLVLCSVGGAIGGSMAKGQNPTSS